MFSMPTFVSPPLSSSRRLTWAPVSPEAACTLEPLANADLTHICARKPSPRGMMRKTSQYDMWSLYVAHPVGNGFLKAAANLLRMPSTGEIAALIEQALPGSKVQVED